MSFLSIFRRAWLFAFILLAATLSNPPPVRAESTLIPLTTRQAMVFDHASQHLYITTTTGEVKRYNLTTKSIDQTYTLGGTLAGIDIAANDAFLLVTQEEPTGSNGIVHRINLTTGEVADIMVPLDNFLGEHALGDIAIASNGLAFVAPANSQYLRVHQIDLATNIATVRDDGSGQGPTYRGPPLQIHRSGDGSLLYFMAGQSSTPGDNQVFTYSAATNTFGDSYGLGAPLAIAAGAVNQNGTLIVTRITRDSIRPAEGHASLDAIPGPRFLHDFNQIDGSVVFGGTTGILYGVNFPNSQIIAYDPNTFAEKFRLAIGETLVPPLFPRAGAGNFVSTPDGKYLALVTSSGIRVIDTASGFTVPAPTPTLSTRRGLVFDHSGRFAYISTSDGFVERFDLTNNTLQIVADLGGSLNGIDIAPDDSFVIAAQFSTGIAQGIFQKLNLATKTISNISYQRGTSYLGYDSQPSVYDNVVIASNQLAFGNTGGRTIMLHRLDLTTNSESVLPNGPEGSAWVFGRSADYSRLVFVGSRAFTYNVAANSFTISPDPNIGFFEGEVLLVNRTATILANHFNSQTVFNSLPDLHFLHPLVETGSGIAFDGTSDVVYAVNSILDQIIAYDTNTFAEKFRFPIGENVSGGGTYSFTIGTLIASSDGKHLALYTEDGVRFIAVPSGPFPPPPTPTMDDPRDLVFDHSGNYLYIGDNNGWVHRYNLATDELDAHYNVGGQPSGIDIAPDDSFLLVAQGIPGMAEGSFQKIDLSSGTITNNPFRFTTYFGSEWAVDVAIAPNGHAIGQTRYQPWQIDPFTGSVTRRTDAHDLSDSSGLARNANASILTIDTHFGLQIYTSATDTFSAPGGGGGMASPSVNRDGSLLMGDGVLESLPARQILHIFDHAGPHNPFDATRDLVYTVDPVQEKIIAYDTNTFAERFRLDIGERTSVEPSFFEYRFGSGNLVASHDGKNIALITPTAVRVYDVSNPPRFPPAVTPRIAPGTETFKRSVNMIITCTTPNSTIYYTLDGSNPTTGSAIFPQPAGGARKSRVKPLKIGSTTTVKAMAVAPNYDQSAIATAVYTKVSKHPPK